MDLKIFANDLSSGNVRLGHSGGVLGNIAIYEFNSLTASTTGVNNIVIGDGTGHLLTSGAANVVVGMAGLQFATTQSNNTVLGSSGCNGCISSDNTALGFQTLVGSNSGGDNTAVGSTSLNANTTGARNSGWGWKSAWHTTTGSDNTAAGAATLPSNVSGSNNTVVGSQSATFTTGSGNTMLGAFAGYYETGSNLLVIGNAITSRIIAGDMSNGRLCFNCNTTGTNLMSLTASALVEMRGTTGGFLPPVLTTAQGATLIALPAATSLHWVNSDSGRLGVYNGTKYVTYATTDMLGSASGVTTVGAFSGSSQANGASISTSTITFGPADGTNPGMIKASGSQTLGPTITFTNAPILTTTSTVNQVWQATGTAGQGGWGNVVTSRNVYSQV